MAKGSKGYPVGLAGESNYQAAICVCREGEPVRICHEIGNPYDEDALVVVSSRNETIGYIPKSSWLREAIHEEGKGCKARIHSIEGEREPMGAVIEVHLTDDELDVRDYAAAERGTSAGSSAGCLVALPAIPLIPILMALNSVV